MNKLKTILLAIPRLIKQFCLLPQSIARTIRQRRRQVILDELEVERLDRIRNPSKYRGR